MPQIWHTRKTTDFLKIAGNFFQIPLTNPSNRRIILNNKNHKGGAVMFANMFYYFYFFNMGCPSFVIPEK